MVIHFEIPADDEAASFIRLPAPSVSVVSAVGAGDSFLRAFVLRLAQGRPVEARSRWLGPREAQQK
ncbi:PfkB family carbohydrate kinase [Arthrobacter sp. 4R501]|uniref:PfkB family carbohydrate kinase n=1 Tax=Arthrobacter sp. 4R501 TaxID=2058886 RepID=UPI0021588423|nr:PfkB family carbohydrate kinase [Arthrobacter sp. 4R501]